jgi:hypothetical protein
MNSLHKFGIPFLSICSRARGEYYKVSFAYPKQAHTVDPIQRISGRGNDEDLGVEDSMLGCFFLLSLNFYIRNI